MAVEKCKDCGNMVSTSASKCPHCGRTLKYLITGPRILILTLAVVFGFIVFRSQQAERKADAEATEFQEKLRRLSSAGSVDHIYDQVAVDAASQYQIAKRQGDPMQICVQAGMVAAGYLQAKDETQYRRWKDTEASDCKRAGVSR